MARDVGGQIEIDESADVFIEVDRSVLGEERLLLACLAHEVCHKLLAVHNVQVGAPCDTDHELENERLTDIAAIWSGLGKLLLNGCQFETEQRDGRRVTITAHGGGYVHIDSLAAAYLLVAHAREVRGRQLTRGLEADALRAIDRARVSVRSLLPGRTPGDVLREARGTQDALARIDEEVRWLSGSWIPAVRRELAARHAQHQRLQSELAEIRRDPGARSSVLRSVGIGLWLENWQAAESDLERLHAVFEPIASHAWHGVLPRRDGEGLRTVTCGICRQRLRLPPDRSDLVAKCSACGYQFSVDTTPGYGDLSATRFRSAVVRRTRRLVSALRRRLSNLW